MNNISRNLILTLIIFTPFIVNSQSWLQDRVIRNSKPKVIQIVAYIIPCDNKDSVFIEEIVMDSNSYVRQIEKFNEYQKIIYSSGSNWKKQSTKVSKYKYDKQKLIFKSESYGGRVAKEFYYSALQNGIKKKMVKDLLRNDSTIFIKKINDFNGIQIESTYKVLGSDTIVLSHSLKNQSNEVILPFDFYGVEESYLVLLRYNSNQIQNLIIVDNKGRIDNTAYIKAEFKNGKLNVNNIDMPEDVDTLYLEQLDEFGNIIRHIIVDQMTNCLTTWYYDIEYKTENNR